jgi:hypothetical protein
LAFLRVDGRGGGGDAGHEEVQMQISRRDDVRLRAIELLHTLRRYGPTKTTLVLRELVDMGFSLEDLGLSAAEVERFRHTRADLRLVRGSRKNGNRMGS